MYLESAQRLVKRIALLSILRDHEYIIYTQNDQKVYNELTKSIYYKIIHGEGFMNDLIDSTPSINKYKRTTVPIILTVVLFHIYL